MLVLVGPGQRVQTSGQLSGEQGGGVPERGSLVPHDDVQLARRPIEQQVAHRAANQLHVVSPRRQLEQRLAAGQLMQPLEHDP